MSSGAPDGGAGARTVEVAAQAKVNLRLCILAREATGFHQLETLFLRLELADTVRVRRTSGARTIGVEGLGDLSDIGPPEKNLAWRAAELYFAATESRGGFAIEITKRIPIGGGLGGGSADAGAVLRALDAMSDDPVGSPFLMMLAAQLGSDVPFLTGEHAYALAWGRGERMVSIPPPPSRGVLLIVPSFAINTASAYGWLAEHRERHPAKRGGAVSLDLAALSDWGRLAALAENDFEGPVAERHPEIDEYVATLRSLPCEVALLSGSGSTVFGVGSATGGGPELLGLAAVPDSAGEARYILTRSAMRVEPLSVIE